MNIERIARNFSRNSETYEQQAQLQQSVARDLMSFIPLQKAGCILDIGCGTGYLTVLLRERFADASVTGIDIASRMIEIARHKVPDARFECCAFEQSPCCPVYDLVVSASTLHWMEDLSFTLARIHQNTAPGGHVALAVFVHGSLCELRESFDRAYKMLELPPNQHTVPFPQKELLLAELQELFTLHRYQERTYTSWYPSPQEALKSLKRTGGGYGFEQNLRYTERKRLFRIMFDSYRDVYGDDRGRVSMSWQVLFVHAQRWEKESVKRRDSVI